MRLTWSISSFWGGILEEFSDVLSGIFWRRLFKNICKGLSMFSLLIHFFLLHMKLDMKDLWSSYRSWLITFFFWMLILHYPFFIRFYYLSFFIVSLTWRQYSPWWNFFKYSTDVASSSHSLDDDCSCIKIICSKEPTWVDSTSTSSKDLLDEVEDDSYKSIPSSFNSWINSLNFLRI